MFGSIHQIRRIVLLAAVIIASFSGPAFATEKWELIEKINPIDDSVDRYILYYNRDVSFTIRCMEKKYIMLKVYTSYNIGSERPFVRYRIDDKKAKTFTHSVYPDGKTATQGIFESKNLVKYLATAQERIVIQIADHPATVINPAGLKETAPILYEACKVDW